MGPGAYDPDYKKVRRAAPTTDFASSKVPRSQIIDDKDTPNKKNGTMPGPGSYDHSANKTTEAGSTKDLDVIEKKKKA